MNKIILLLVIISFACSNDDGIINNSKVDNIPFTGTWKREFSAGEGNNHEVFYHIYQDSIRYILNGPVGNANYVMKRDTFLLKNNRYIGHTSNNQHFLIFVKEHKGDSISIYKKKVKSISEGLAESIPATDDTSNHGWNIYFKN